MDCYFRQSWQDRRLRFNGPRETLSLSIKMLEGIWKPDTFFYNGKKSYVHTITQPNKLLRIKRDGSILYSVRFRIRIPLPSITPRFNLIHSIDTKSIPMPFTSNLFFLIMSVIYILLLYQSVGSFDSAFQLCCIHHFVQTLQHWFTNKFLLSSVHFKSDSSRIIQS